MENSVTNIEWLFTAQQAIIKSFRRHQSMDSEVKLFIERAEHEFRLASALFKLSQDTAAKKILETNQQDTFYSAVITHGYYAIFYAVKSLLLTKNISTKAPEVHNKTIEAFKKEFVDTGFLDIELFKIYQKMII